VSWFRLRERRTFKMLMIDQMTDCRKNAFMTWAARSFYRSI